MLIVHLSLQLINQGEELDSLPHSYSGAHLHYGPVAKGPLNLISRAVKSSAPVTFSPETNHQIAHIAHGTYDIEHWVIHIRRQASDIGSCENTLFELSNCKEKVARSSRYAVHMKVPGQYVNQGLHKFKSQEDFRLRLIKQSVF